MNRNIPQPQKGKTKLLVGIIVLVVIVVGFLSYYTILAPREEITITSGAEANEKISDLQNQLQAMANDLTNISEEL